MEGGSPFGSDVAHVHDGLRVIRVNVEDGSVHHARYIGGVRRGAGHAGIGGEANLNQERGERGKKVHRIIQCVCKRVKGKKVCAQRVKEKKAISYHLFF